MVACEEPFTKDTYNVNGPATDAWNVILIATQLSWVISWWAAPRNL